MKKHLTPIVIFACSTFALHAQQVSPLVVNHDLPNLSALGNPAAGFPQLRLQLRVPGNTPSAPPVVEGDLTIGLFDWGSGQNGIFQLNNPNGGSGGSWTWQRGMLSGTPRVEMELNSNGELRLFGNGTDNILLRPTTNGVDYSGNNWQGPAGVYVNGSRLVSEAFLANGLLPEIQALTMQVGTALSLGDVNGIIGTGSMAAGLRASVYGSGSLAFGTDAHVGAPLSITGTVLPANYGYANDAVALGNAANARGHGAMAFGTRSNAATRQSIAIGEDSEASGGTSIYWGGAGYDMGSVAVGTKARALGIATAAFGISARAYGNESIAIGPMAITWPGSTGAVALGWSATACSPGSLALGNMSRSLAIGGVCLGSLTFTTGASSAAIGSYIEATGAGMIAVGTAPDFTGLTSNANWDDMNSVVFIVGGGKNGPYVGGTGGWTLSDWAVSRRTSLSVTRGGDVKASGKITASKTGGLLVPDTLEAKNGTTRLQGTILIDRQGDISMGEFTQNPPPIIGH